jgi:hypothetical protein
VVWRAGGGVMSFAVIGAVATWSAVILGFAAAALWFWATKVEILNDENDHHNTRLVEVDVETGRTTDTRRTAMAQTYWNSWAAAATAASVLCQAVATALSKISH